MPKKDAGQTREAILAALSRTGLPRREIAAALDVGKQSVDRWASTGRISLDCWNGLQKLIVDLPSAQRPLGECSLDEITAELERRHWKVTLERIVGP